VPRRTIEAYAAERGLEWREDPTNTTGEGARSLLRTEVLPKIETLFPGASERIAHTAALMRELVDATLGPERRSRLDAAFEARDPGGWLDGQALRDMAPVWRRRVVLDALEAALPTAPRTDAVARRVTALLDAQVGRRVPLGEGIVWRERGGLRLVPERPGGVPPTPLPIGETVETARGTICVERVDAPPDDLSAGAPPTAYADADRLGSDLVVRSWADGDRIQPLGMDGTKSVADLLTDAQVPPHRREHVLVVTTPQHVAWVAGIRLDHRVRVRDETRHYAKLTLR
jgi:tRNA(Ile)-lysidine synthase